MPDDRPDGSPAGPSEAQRRNSRQLLEASSIGWMFPLAIALGYLWGLGMDHLFGTTWLRYLFGGFGIIAAFINLFRIALADHGNDSNGGPSGPGA